MRLDERIRKCVVFVGLSKNGRFVPYGTGFIAVNFIRDKGFQSLVTAKHVLDNINSDVFHVRVNTLDGVARVLPLDKAHCHPHPDLRVDMVVCATMIPKTEYDIMHLPVDDELGLTDEANKRELVDVGDDVAIAGMFEQRLGDSKNIPIIRSGTIAAMPEEKIETQYGYHDAYLIEARSIDGLSGSPVFLQLPASRWIRGKEHKSTRSVYFMGMLIGHHQVTNPTDAVEIKNPHKEKPPGEVVYTPLNTGIGIVIPFSCVVEAITQPILNQRREQTMRDQKGSGFKADSVSHPSEDESTTEDLHPEGKERFTRLLDAAANKRPKAERT